MVPAVMAAGVRARGAGTVGAAGVRMVGIIVRTMVIAVAASAAGGTAAITGCGRDSGHRGNGQESGGGYSYCCGNDFLREIHEKQPLSNVCHLFLMLLL